MKNQTVSSSNKNKGIIYIVLMAFFTLVMIADLLNLALTPAMGTMNFSDLNPSSNSFFNGNNEASNGQFFMPGGETPEGFTPPDGEFPEGFTMPGGESPEGFTPPNNVDFTMPSGEFSFPDGNTDRFPSNGRRPLGGGSGFLLFVRRAWLPILIVCLIGNGVCLFIFIRIRRKSSAETQQSHAEPEEGTEDDETAKKKKKGSWILPVCLVIAVAAVIASLPHKNSDTDAVSANEQILSSTAKKGTIATVISGTGTLTNEAAKQVSIPDSVTVTAFYVNNGDTVATGDVWFGR